jgi:hypothetical protein
MDAPMKHIVLLGYSVFDNAAYVVGGPDVVEQLRKRLPAGWRATLRAVDGSVTASIERQLHQLRWREAISSLASGVTMPHAKPGSLTRPRVQWPTPWTGARRSIPNPLGTGPAGCRLNQAVPRGRPVGADLESIDP